MWNDLSMAQRGELMKVFIQNGIYDLNTMKKEYDSMHQSGDEVTLPNYSQNVFAEGGNIDGNPDDIDNRTGKPRYRREIHDVNITSSYGNNIEGTARDTSTIGPLAFYPPKYYIGKQGNQFEENPNVTYDSWFDEHPEMIDVMTDIVGRYNNRLNNRGQQLPQLNRFYFEKLYNPEDDPIIHEAIERMLQAKWNRDVRTYNDNRTLNLWDTVEKFPAANVKYATGGQLGYITPYGQWQYPHQVTTIPSNNITMRGVDYPVVGVSDTGDAKVMLPGLDYLYDGNYVTEYPV